MLYLFTKSFECHRLFKLFLHSAMYDLNGKIKKYKIKINEND